MSLTFLDQTVLFFKSRVGEWIPATAFERVGGRQAWRSRIAECRTKRGMHIENRLRVFTLSDGEKYTVSEYRYLE